MLFDCFFPHYCPVCSTPTRDLLCLRCEPLLFHIAITVVPFTTVPLMSFGRYSSPAWRTVVHAGKFFGEQRLLAHIGSRAARITAVQEFCSNALLAPIPLHTQRLRERGYNQATCIADGIARTLNAHSVSLLSRTGSTQPQSQRVGKEKTHADFSFSCRLNIPKHTRIILIDDVCTSGTTLQLAIHTLRTAGYTDIRACVLAMG